MTNTIKALLLAATLTGCAVGDNLTDPDSIPLESCTDSTGGSLEPDGWHLGGSPAANLVIPVPSGAHAIAFTFQTAPLTLETRTQPVAVDIYANRFASAGEGPAVLAQNLQVAGEYTLVLPIHHGDSVFIVPTGTAGAVLSDIRIVR